MAARVYEVYKRLMFNNIDLDTFILGDIRLVDSSDYASGGMAEPDPLDDLMAAAGVEKPAPPRPVSDDLMEAAGIGKDAGLPPVERRSYIERTIEFEEAQKKSRERIAEIMGRGDKVTESQLNYQADPRPTGPYAWVRTSPIFDPNLPAANPVIPDPAAALHDAFKRFRDSVQDTLDAIPDLADRLGFEPEPLPDVVDMDTALERKKILNERKARDNNRKGWKH